MGDRAEASVEEYGWSRATENLVNIWQEQVNYHSSKSDRLVSDRQLHRLTFRFGTINTSPQMDTDEHR